MSPGFPEAPLRDTLPMCHSPLRHGLRQATHNTLRFSTWLSSLIRSLVN
jgi:hypothetical protein